MQFFGAPAPAPAPPKPFRADTHCTFPGKPPAAQRQKSDAAAKPAPAPSGTGSPTSSSPGTPKASVICGDGLTEDMRVRRIFEREKFLLTVIIPRYRTFGDAMQEWMRRTMHPLVLAPLFICLLIHIGAMVLCTTEGGGNMCAGGPELDAESESSWATRAFSEYGPPIINALATLMLSFYANVCMTLYKEGYFACQCLKESTLDIMSVVVGTIPPQMRELRMEFWRCVNLYHLCAYVLADKSRQTYSLDNFLIPIATAFGDYDGVDKFGMLSLEEIRLLSSDPDASIAARTSVVSPDNDTEWVVRKMTTRQRAYTDKEREALQKEKGKGGKAGGIRRLDSSKSWLGRRKTGLANSPSPSPASAAARPAGAAPAATGLPPSLINSRGDVSSPTAMLQAALGVRMYMLVDLALTEKLSRAAWPVWNALCLKMRTNAECLKQRALFRLPRIYQASVRFFVSCAVLTDTFLLASHAAGLIRRSHADPEWAPHAYFGAALDFVLNIMLTWCLSVFLNAISDMQNPFGSETLDMPGLSYVCASSELTLRMVLGSSKLQSRAMSSAKPNKLFQLLNSELDRAQLMKGMPSDRGSISARKSHEGEGARKEGRVADDDEEEDAGDE